MIKTFLSIFTAIIIVGFSEQKQFKATAEHNNYDGQSFPSFVKGVWVLTEYIDEIERTDSPAASSEKLNGIVTMIIDDIPKADSITIGASWNNHEGYNFTVYLEKGKRENSYKTNLPDYETESNFYELGYEYIKQTPYLFLYLFSSENELLDKKQFTKVAEKQTDDDAAWGIQYIVNEKLFAGEYYFRDSLHTGKQVFFWNDGSVTGLKNYYSYTVATDFNAIGPDEEYADAIVFDSYTDNETVYLFEITADTLYLLNGELEFNLIRQ